MKRIGVIGCGLILPVTFLVLSNWARPMGKRSALLSNMARKALSEDNAAGYRNGAVQRGEVVVSYSLVKDQFTLHEPVILNFKVKNGLAEPVELNLGADRREHFLFTVRQPDGSRLQSPQLSSPSDLEISLKPGQTYAQELLLSEWFDFPITGRYEVTAQLVKPIVRTQAGTTIRTDTVFHTEVVVGPRDVDRLEQVCAGLAAQIATGGSYDEIRNAARALSYIKDPVAVQYLEKALSTNWMLEGIIVGGLARIGGEEATNVLISALKRQPRQNIREFIRPALLRISANTSDRALKEKIKQALSKG